MFCHHLWVTSSVVVLPALFNSVVGRKESDSNVVDAVIPGVLLLLHRWVTAVPTASVAGALYSNRDGGKLS
jgi:hypothetical protein